MAHKLEGMSGREIRKLMFGQGWDSIDRYSNIGWSTPDKGIYGGYSIWFERWNWHGFMLGAKICFHQHTPNFDDVDECIRKAAEMALDAWEKYTDAVPCQMADGSLAEDTVATKTVRMTKNMKRGDKNVGVRGERKLLSLDMEIANSLEDIYGKYNKGGGAKLGEEADTHELHPQPENPTPTNMNIIEEILETSEQTVDKKTKECRRAFRNELRREPAEKEIEAWLLFD